jgi:phosphatidylserine/phosphatidylglycerophosphate/cardiolipin synthase-like enzyme
LVERQLLEQAAHRGELEVRVRVDQPGHQDRAPEVDRAVRRGERGRRLRRGAHPRDRAAVHAHRSVA